MAPEALDAKVYLDRVFVMAQLALDLRGIRCHAIVDGIRCPHVVVGDLAAIVDAFHELGTDENHVADAFTAGVLDHFRVQQRIPNHDSTPAIYGRKLDG